MARRSRDREEPENLERWLISYADFITLLFAFFVVMYAISSVNEGKYRVLAETLNTVFASAPRNDAPIQVGEPLRDLVAFPDDLPVVAKAADAPAPGDESGGPDPAHRHAAMTRIFDELVISLQQYIDGGLVSVNQVDGRVEIEMKERMLFGSGAARLSREALPALRDLARTLGRIPHHLQVEGHTDNVPIASAAFPSNWELSAARAASVVHFFARAGVEPWRMAAVGLGEHRPLAENADARGRAANRRVTVVVLGGQRTAEPQVGYEVPWAEGPALRGP